MTPLEALGWIAAVLLCCPLTWGFIAVIWYGWYEEGQRKRNPPLVDRL
jgi:hypothetical protein